MSNTIGVLGCGWLGLPLAISLIKNNNKVHGSTTSKEKLVQLKEQNIIPFEISLFEDKLEGNISGFLRNITILIINVPPKLRGTNKENYVQKIQLLHQEIKKYSIEKVVFVSSTSVYGNISGDVTESTIPQPSTESGKQLFEAENIFKNDADLKTTIIRFGGLIGPKRHPITMLAGRKELSNGHHPVNLIHLDDCIRIIVDIIDHSWWNETLNGVYPDHPNKQEYYKSEAEKRGVQSPDYKDINSKKGKKIHSKVLINVKKYKFTTSL